MDKHLWTAHETTDLGAIIRAGGRVIATEVSMVDAQFLCAKHNATIDKPSKPSILDEEWEVAGMSNRMNNYHKIETGNGWIKAVAADGYEKQVAACPDAYRALKDMVADAKQGKTRYDCEVSLESLTSGRAALKKAGIE